MKRLAAMLMIGMLASGVLATPIRADDGDYHVYLPLVTQPIIERIRNADFEGGQWQEVRWWRWPCAIASDEQFDEDRPAGEWTGWWVENQACNHNPYFATGRPEFTLITTAVDARRVVDGTQAAKAFTFWRCGLFGYFQRITLPAGEYRFGAFIHTWYTSCSSDPYGPLPRDKNCLLFRTGEHMRVWLGVARGDVTDFWENIIWSDAYERYGTYGPERFWSPTIRLDEAATITLWIKTESDLPLRHNDLYMDSAVVERLP